VTNVEPFDKEYVPPAAKAITEGGGKYIVRGVTNGRKPRDFKSLDRREL
jgi:hypothetical protein